jgi:hypothetical protein
MNDISLDAAGAQPTRQPETVAACLESYDDALDGCPARTASSRQRCSNRSNPSSSGTSFFNGSRPMPGTIPPTNQVLGLD